MVANEHFERLFEPGQIGPLRLKNRIVMAPMVNHYGTDTGAVSERSVEYYAERAKGGVGMIIVEATCVDAPVGRGWPCGLRIDDERFMASHNRLTDAVHSHGAKIAVQLHHAGRATRLTATEGAQPVAPSASGAARELTIEEIEELVGKFAAAAERARRAGYDAVELHGAHSYLIHQFISPVSNRRSDLYGGSLFSRLRFATEIIQRIKSATGSDYPVTMRISGEGGYSIEESRNFAKLLESAGLDGIHVSSGGIAPIEGGSPETSPMALPQGRYAHLAEAIKKEVAIPIITVGEIREPEFAEGLLRAGKADFVALGRQLLADPYWPQKAQEGRAEDIRKCISCGYCAMSLAENTPMHCAVNPAVGRERELADIVPAPVKKRVMVVGSGPAGMEASRIAALRGHEVSLYEKGPELGGGQLKLAAVPPQKEKITWVGDYLVNQIRKLSIEVHTGTEVDVRTVEEAKPDVVIVACGARPLIPDVPGVDGENVVTTNGILLGKVEPKRKKVFILGGRQTGCEVAESLCDRGNSVTVVARSPASQLAAGAYPGIGRALLARLRAKKVEFITEHDVQEIQPTGLTLVDKKGRQSFHQADLIVLARGAVPVRELADQLQGKVPELYIIGDSAEVRNIQAAIYDGTLISRRI